MTVKHNLTVEDYEAMPDDGKRYEVLAGELYEMAAPTLFHQRVSKRLQRQLEAFFERNGLAEVFDAPVDVVLSRHDVAQPDIVVVPVPLQFSRRAIEDLPLLVVEVLSPSSRKHDLERKAGRYLELGILHYWVLDPDERSLVCRKAAGDRYVSVAQGREREHVCDPEWPALVIDLAALWPDVEAAASA